MFLAKTLNMDFILMAGMAGFEPTNDGVKVRCLTTWRHPNNSIYIKCTKHFCYAYFKKWGG